MERCLACEADLRVDRECRSSFLPGFLGGVGSQDRDEHVAETFLEFRDTGRVVHFDAFAFATDQAGFAQDLEMLGEGRFGQGAVVDSAEVRTVQGAFRC